MLVYVDILLLLWLYHRPLFICHYFLDFLDYFDPITMRFKIIFEFIDWIGWFDIHKSSHHPKILLLYFLYLGFLKIFRIRFWIWDRLARLGCSILTPNLWKAAFTSETHVYPAWIFDKSSHSNIWLRNYFSQLLIIVIFILWFNRILTHSNACLLMLNSCIVLW